jgi:hypothetical protein
MNFCMKRHKRPPRSAHGPQKRRLGIRKTRATAPFLPLGNLRTLQEKPNDALNQFKLKFIHGALAKLNRLLGDYRPFEDFEQFDPDVLPTNSDVVLILSQYAGATHLLRTEQTVEESDDGDWHWIVRGKTSDLTTKSPAAFKYTPN